ncbi:hypothetical protein QQX98_006493 [Neonectria punicea]|uniref:Peptidase S8/S53 domain-containing protein n=1 Tax=Neonectria punicea TaxID=979145 RepID=A0ABR1H0S2_9HYPO
MSDAEDRDSRRESDDEDDDDESDEEDDFTRMTQQATSDMRKIFNGRATEDDIDQFIRDHHEVVTQVGQDRTFLHTIVQLVYDRSNEKSVKAPHIKPLVRRLMRDYPYLLRTKNDEGQNPLYRAIHLKKNTWKLVDYMLNSCVDRQCIEDALESPCGKGESLKTCLTLAFEKGLSAEVLRNLINHASEKALKFPDGSGRTPLHCAVQYDQCSDERVDIIKLLLKKDGEAVDGQRSPGSYCPVDTFLDRKYTRKEDMVEYSVYGEHKRTARFYLAEELLRKQQEADQERAELKAPSLHGPLRTKDPPKASFREKDPKSQSNEDRDRGAKKPDLDRERRRQESEKLDENELRRKQLREEEERNRKAKEDKKQSRDQAPEHGGLRAKQARDQKDRPMTPIDSTSGLHKIQPNQKGTDHAPNTPLKRVSTHRSGIDEEKKQRDRKPPLSRKSAPKGPSPTALAKNSARIITMLKLHYMRTRSLKMATSFLYGKNIKEDIQICFDYVGLPSEIQDHVFTERFGKDRNSGIRFDEVLMYVRFPNVTVIRTGRRAPKPRALGRQDMEFFFDWLYCKGVRRILKVEVEDSGKICHSDESIQNSLDKIIVEHLDWQKVDLDPRVICQISGKSESRSSAEADPNNELVRSRNRLREVTLKWSGNNAVLRAWSEAEGLPQLQKLETINLSIPAPSDLYDTRNWVQSNLEEFQVRLNQFANENRNTGKNGHALAPNESGVTTEAVQITPPQERKVKVTVREGKGNEIPVSPSNVQKTVGRSNPITEHEWLNCMERFAGCMDIFWRRTLEISLEQLGQGHDNHSHLPKVDTQARTDLQNLKKDVVVALIDDGVDSCDSAFSGRAIEGKTFDYQDGGVRQYYISAKGHGTEMARMILKVCPMASIYSIRLKTHTSPDKGHATIDAVSAALAIEAALEKNATIISMSWTIPVPPEGSEEKRLLDSVLERACKQKVLMFCSSSDQISSTEHYPSAFRRRRFFLIGAAHDDGSAYGHAGKDNDFIFPGVNVNTTGGSSLPVYLADKTSSTKESTGSSVATALAAGLAAMITYCFKASALAIVTARTQQGKDYGAGPELVKPGDADRIAEHNILKTAFSRIGKMESGQFIPVWDRFGPASQVLEAENKYEDKLTHIMNLCSNLIER